MVTLNLYFKLSYRIFRPRAGKTSLRGRDDEATLDGPSPLLEEPLSAPSKADSPVIGLACSAEVPDA